MRKLILTVLIFASALAAGAQAEARQSTVQVPANQAALFATDEVANLTLTAPLAELFAHKGNHDAKKKWIPGQLSNGSETVPVEIRMRGYSTLFYCRFPKLTLKFSKDLPDTSAFAKLGKLDVGTHCDLPKADDSFSAAMQFNHREALIYKWLKILDIPAYAARAANITYVDTSSKDPIPNVSKSAVLIENLSSFLKRVDGKEIDANTFTEADKTKLDLKHLAFLNLFTSLIGDYDHRFEPKPWNFRVVELKDGRWLPILMDFNLATIAMGKTVFGYSGREDFYKRPPRERLEHLLAIHGKLPELKASVSALADDNVGYEAFSKTLESQTTQLQYVIDRTRAEVEQAGTQPSAPTAP